MPQDRMNALFFEIFTGLPRQGAGDDASTLRALSLVPGIGRNTRVLDLGCGTGKQTLLLAQHSPARFVAIDNHPPYVEELNRQAQALGIADRVEARVGDMRQLDLAPASFDLIWCEGAIWVVGWEPGLRDWRRFLVPGGYVAVSEVCWSKPDPPPECATFWTKAYPAIRYPSELVSAVADCGYELVGHFPMPASCWWDDYYRPLQSHVTQFRLRHNGEADALELADQIQREIDQWHTYSDFYHYEFFVMRSR